MSTVNPNQIFNNTPDVDKYLPNNSTDNTVEQLGTNYKISKNLGQPFGIEDDKFSELKSKEYNQSIVNKLHLIRVASGIKASDTFWATENKLREPKTFVDLCRNTDVEGAAEYDVDDFLYCKHLGTPLNRLITLRRFPLPCTDNIWNTSNQQEPDVARMITFINQDNNKIEELLQFSYRMLWKELTADLDQMETVGSQSGFSGYMAQIMRYIDPVNSQDTLRGENARNFNPKHDQNKVYGPVDSVNKTHIRDVGFEFDKEFELIFHYDLKSINGRTPEYAMRDILANVLAVTYNNGKFWPGARYWVGERPSAMLEKFRFLSPDRIDEFFNKGWDTLVGIGNQLSKNSTQSNLQLLKNILTNVASAGLGQILDKVGRPSIVVMDSLLSGEPIGLWHLTIGNPDNPIMCIGDLILMDTDISFPSDALSYGDFPTEMVVKIKLKPSKPRDKAGIEMMFNMGKERIYYNPKKIYKSNNKSINNNMRRFFNYGNENIKEMGLDALDYLPGEEINAGSNNSYVQRILDVESQVNIRNNNEPNFSYDKTGIAGDGSRYYTTTNEDGISITVFEDNVSDMNSTDDELNELSQQEFTPTDVLPEHSTYSQYLESRQ